MTVITLDGQSGGGARLLGPLIAQELGLNYVDRLILHSAAQRVRATVSALNQKEERLPTRGERFARMLQKALDRLAISDDLIGSVGVPEFLIEEYENPIITTGHDLEDAKYLKALQEVIRELAEQGNVVLVGRGSCLILRDNPHVLRVGMVAHHPDCVARIQKLEHVSQEDAKKIVLSRDRARAAYFKMLFHVADPDRPEFYDLVINTSDVAQECAVEMVVQAAKALESGRLRASEARGELAGVP